MISSLLIPAVESIEQREELLEITLCSQTTLAICPDCKAEQSHVHKFTDPLVKMIIS